METTDIKLFAFEELAPSIQQLVIDNFRSNPANFEKFGANFHLEYFEPFNEFAHSIGLKIIEGTIKIHPFDGCSYIANVDLLELLQTPMTQIQLFYPTQYYELSKSKIIVEEITPAIQKDPSFINIRYQHKNPFHKANIDISSRPGTHIPANWTTEIESYVEKCYRPLNRGLLHEMWQSYCYIHSIGNIEDSFKGQLFTRMGTQVKPSDL